MGIGSKAMWSLTRQLNGLSGLTRYVLAAMLARMATGGAAVAIILLARSYGADGKMAGLFAACLTAPHVFGPIYGRWLDEARDPCIIITAACILFAGFFQLTIWSFDWDLIWLGISCLLICGTCSSFMMGGLSTQLTKLVDDDIPTRRRAQSWDTITYGFGLTMGPMLIAVLTAVYSTQLTVSILMGLPVLAGLIILCQPKLSNQQASQAEAMPSFKRVIQIMHQSGQLRRTLGMTSGASFSVAALPVLAVYFSEAWQQSQESGAYLVTFYGIGCLCGAILLMFKPMKAEALTLLRNVGAGLFVTLILVALSQSFSMGLASYWLCGVINSIFFAVTLAARTEYAPQQGAAQIYMWVAAAKISAASLGAFVAGFLVDLSISLPMILSSAVLALTLIVCFGKKTA